jgi:phytoene dehydrogenase-like protein
VSSSPDIVIIGAGPNGLSAAVLLAQAKLSVRVIEARDEVGGGTRSKELTLPGFVHDVCSSVHPMGALSPYLRTLPLAAHGLEWLYPEYSAAHPLDDGPAPLLARSFERTGDTLGGDADRWKRWFSPFAERAPELFADLLAPLGIPRSPLLFARFGLSAFRSARSLAGRFRGERARALFAGCAAHSILPLDFWFSGAVGMVFAISGHAVDWPVARGGSHAITLALASYARSLGVEIVTRQEVDSIEALPNARAYLFDTAPTQLATIAAKWLPRGYLARLNRYVYGPGVFKVDFALSEPIPWRDPQIGKASTVHVGGTLEEIHASERDAWRGEHSERPFVMLSQQSHFDASRAPAGKHTGHAYCHVPNGSTLDMTAKLEQQIERFAPGFRDTILARHVMSTRDFQAYNPSCVGGAVTGGAAHLTQLFTRPVARLDPYSTPHPRVFLCSASTPPGGGVHGMGGYWAARSVLRRLRIALPS